MIQVVALLDEAERRGIVGAGAAQMLLGNILRSGEDSFAGGITELTGTSLAASEFATREPRRVTFTTQTKFRRDVRDVPREELHVGELILVLPPGLILASGVNAP
jgi:hypothetical protein